MIVEISGGARGAEERAALHAALADPLRVAVVDALAMSDRTPGELSSLLGVSSNLLAHHLGVLDDAAIIERRPSSGDGRRAYVHLVPGRLGHLAVTRSMHPAKVLFVCTANSARSQLAEAVWNAGRRGVGAESAGTHPAGRVHPKAVRAARRRGLDLATTIPRPLGVIGDDALLVTVCDQAREELGERVDMHWSVADPVNARRRDAFDEAADEIVGRVAALRDIVDPPQGRST